MDSKNTNNNQNQIAKVIYIHNDLYNVIIKYTKGDSNIWETPNLSKHIELIDIFEFTVNTFPFSISITPESGNDNSTIQQIQESGLYYIHNNEIIKFDDKVNIPDKFYLMTDLDGTLLGEDEGLRKFNQIWLRYFMGKPNVKLIYNTGRNFTQTCEFKRKINFLWPDICICNCGTKIYNHNTEKGILELDQEWQNIINEKWSYDKVKDYFVSFEWFNYLGKESDANSIWGKVKIKDFELCKSKLEEAKEIFKKDGIEFKVSFSGFNHTEYRFLDIFSLNSGKNNAFKFISEKYKCDLSNILCCGDNVNDIEILEECKWGVLVSNASIEALEWYENKGKYNKGLTFSSKNNANAINEELIKRFDLDN